ncbi:uncharacterized protein PAC_08162 [Phialocephala subalpina]|uniref:Uncharacterized protein n=1 Tax=Phialocephala subalpina TaxID=576137 RepID=A0A1L7WZR5_9HELO|nr:uncharacterized protein PAC_08162 [Phialocephala subalpina]
MDNQTPAANQPLPTPPADDASAPGEHTLTMCILPVLGIWNGLGLLGHYNPLFELLETGILTPSPGQGILPPPTTKRSRAPSNAPRGPTLQTATRSRAPASAPPKLHTATKGLDPIIANAPRGPRSSIPQRRPGSVAAGGGYLKNAVSGGYLGGRGGRVTAPHVPAPPGHPAPLNAHEVQMIEQQKYEQKQARQFQPAVPAGNGRDIPDLPGHPAHTPQVQIPQPLPPQPQYR